MQTNPARGFFGLGTSLPVLLGMVVLIGMGEKMAERFLPLYLIALGGGPYSIGLLNGLDNLLSALYSFPGGYASDRLGAKRALLLFNLLAMAGFLIVVVFPYWQAVILGAILFISWEAISLPASMSVIAQVLPANKQVMGVSAHSLVRRVPMALGPLLGGALITARGEEAGVRIAFGAAFVLAGLALVLQQTLLPDSRRLERATGAAPAAPVPAAGRNPLLLIKGFSPALRRLLIADILIRFCEQIPYAFVVVWCVERVGISPAQFGVLTAIEMVVALLIYIPVAALADRGTKKPYVVITFIFFSLFPPVLYFARSFWPLVLAFVVRGLKEFGEPTRKSLILDLCPPETRASAFGAYYLARDVVVSAAVIGGAWLWTVSPEANFLTAFGFGLLGFGFYAAFGREKIGVSPAV